MSICPQCFHGSLKFHSGKKKNSVFSFIIIHCKPPLKGTKDYFLRLITADKF